MLLPKLYDIFLGTTCLPSQEGRRFFTFKRIRMSTYYFNKTTATTTTSHFLYGCPAAFLYSNQKFPKILEKKMLPSTLDVVPSPSTWNPRPPTLDKKIDYLFVEGRGSRKAPRHPNLFSKNYIYNTRKPIP